MNGFEVPYPDNVVERFALVEFNTWGHVWDAPGEKGPEPYMMEYEFGTMITQALDAVGFKDLEIVEYSYFESVFIATKN